jgi:hypothetical protein
MEDLSRISAHAHTTQPRDCTDDAGTPNGLAAAAMTDPPLSSGEARFFAALNHTLSRFSAPSLLQYI